MSNEVPTLVGMAFVNRYRVDAELGRGGMGVIYRAHDTVLDRPVALKVLTQAGLGTEGRNRLLREARAAARLNHPNIVSIYDAGETDGLAYIVMELVEGGSLYQRWPFTLPDVLVIARQVCDALDHAHNNGIVHRDLKLENILLQETPSPAPGEKAASLPGVRVDLRVKLTDFGLARSLASRVTTEGALVGTVFYLAPEQALGQPVDGRADLYALGVVLYELTTGKLPFTAEDPLAVISQHLYAPVTPPRTHRPELPPALDALIVQLLSKAPDDRPATAAEVRRRLDQLEDINRVEPAQADSLSPLDRLVRGRLIGREREKAEMTALWRKAAGGESQVLLISGEPGIGKTRLVRELMTLAEVSGGEAYLAECYAEGAAPYAPVGQVMESALSLQSPLSTLPPLILADLLTLAPSLRARFPDVPPNPSLSPQADQQRLFESALELCARRARQRPLLIVLDDAHWADSGTLLLIRHLARRLRPPRLPVLLVLTYREIELDQARALNDVLSDLQRERLAVRLKLTRLTREQTGELLRVMFATDISDDLLDGLYRETEGNPFFIEEVCKALVEQGAIYRQDGTWQRAAMEQLQIPQSVRVAIQSRVSQLNEPAQNALRLAAVIGREFDFATLLRAGELNEEALVEALEVAERAQLITEARTLSARRAAAPETFSFVHALIPAALRESVSGLRRHRLHKRVAAALAQLRPDDFEALAYHYGQAGDETQARRYYRQAGDRARAVYANEDALRFYSEALALIPEGEPDHFDLLAARAEVYDLTARRAEQGADVQAMLALAEKLGDEDRRFQAVLADVDYHLATEMFRAQPLAERAVEFARQRGDRLGEGQALRRLGWVTRVRGDFRQSRDHLLLATERFREAGQLAEAANCLHTLSLALSDLNEEAEAERAVREALALSRQMHDRRQEAISLRRLGISLQDQRRHAEALPVVQEALTLHRQLGDREAECHALNVLALVNVGLNRLAEAEAYARQSAELGEAIGSTVGFMNAMGSRSFVRLIRRGYQPLIQLIEAQLARDFVKSNLTLTSALIWNLAETLADIGQPARALELSDSVMPNLESFFGAGNRAVGLAEYGRVLADLGRLAEARLTLEQALQMGRENEHPLVMGRILYEQSYVLLLESESAGAAPALPQQARDALAQAIASARQARYFESLTFSLNYAADVHLALGDAEAALVASTECLELTERYPQQYYLHERFWYTHARALRAVGRAAEAHEYLSRAYRLITDIAESFTEAVLRQGWLTNVRANRGVLAEMKGKS